MIPNLVDKLFDCFSEFTWKRFFALVVVIALMLISFSLFERYTSSFRLNRLQKSVELLIKVQEIEKTATTGSPEIKRASKEIMKQTLEAIEVKPLSLDIFSSTFTFSIDHLWKFIAGSLFWAIVALTRLPKIIRGEKRARASFFGILFLAIITGMFAMQIPGIWWPWGHLILYPMSVVASFYISIIPFAVWWYWPCPSSEKTTKENTTKKAE